MKIAGLLRSLNPSSALAATIGRINDAFDTLRKILTKNISLTDNIACELYTGYFTHGIPVSITLKSLSTAQSAIVLSSTIPCVATPQVTGSSGAAQVTLAFARNAKRVQVTIVLFPEGALLSGQQLALTATSKAPGQVIPDNTTITVDDATGTISAVGSGSALSRIFPTDANDVLVYHLDEVSNAGPWANSGSAGTQNLTLLAGAVNVRAGLFPNGTALGSGLALRGNAQDNVGGASTVEPAYPVTFSLWWFHAAQSNGCSIFAKMYRPMGTWSSPYIALQLGLNDSAGNAQFALTTGGAIVSVNGSNTYDRLAVGAWNLLVGTYDGATAKLYVNGALIASASVSGAIDYGTHGPWVTEQSTSGAGQVTGIVDEIRLANVDRGAAWVANYWKTAMLLD